MRDKKLKASDADVAEVYFVAVMLEGDVAIAVFHEKRLVSKFALGDQRTHCGTAPVVFYNLCVVQPVLNVAVFADDADVIPFAGGEELFRIIRRNQIIQAASGKFWRFAIGMIWIVIDLHFRTRPVSVSGRLAHAVENSAIGALGDFPIKGQFKIFELLACNQIRARAFDTFQDCAIANPVGWKRLLMKSAKGVGDGFAGPEI